MQLWDKWPKYLSNQTALVKNDRNVSAKKNKVQIRPGAELLNTLLMKLKSYMQLITYIINKSVLVDKILSIGKSYLQYQTWC